jgi:hypothetical protein
VRVELGALQMHAAIDFDHEAGLGAHEVSDVAADGNLAAKGDAQTAAAQRTPETLFGERWGVTQLVSFGFELTLARDDVARTTRG